MPSVSIDSVNQARSSGLFWSTVAIFIRVTTEELYFGPNPESNVSAISESLTVSPQGFNREAVFLTRSMHSASVIRADVNYFQRLKVLGSLREWQGVILIMKSCWSGLHQGSRGGSQIEPNYCWQSSQHHDKQQRVGPIPW